MENRHGAASLISDFAFCVSLGRIVSMEEQRERGPVSFEVVSEVAAAAGLYKSKLE